MAMRMEPLLTRPAGPGQPPSRDWPDGLAVCPSTPLGGPRDADVEPPRHRLRADLLRQEVGRVVEGLAGRRQPRADLDAHVEAPAPQRGPLHHLRPPRERVAAPQPVLARQRGLHLDAGGLDAARPAAVDAALALDAIDGGAVGAVVDPAEGAGRLELDEPVGRRALGMREGP